MSTNWAMHFVGDMQTIHAICELGLSILKRLVPEVQVSGIDVVPLPSMLFKAIDNSPNDSMTVSHS